MAQCPARFDAHAVSLTLWVYATLGQGGGLTLLQHILSSTQPHHLSLTRTRCLSPCGSTPPSGRGPHPIPDISPSFSAQPLAHLRRLKLR